MGIHASMKSEVRLSAGMRRAKEVGFPHSSVGKETSCNAGDPGSIPGSGRSAREGKGCPFQCSGLENAMDCIVHGSQSCT